METLGANFEVIKKTLNFIIGVKGFELETETFTAG
jgi:hypothetical protein